jgi:hypothetical protein
MASHTRAELQDAAATLAAAVREVVGELPKPAPVALPDPVRGRIYDGLAEAA